MDELVADSRLEYGQHLGAEAPAERVGAEGTGRHPEQPGGGAEGEEEPVHLVVS